MQWLWSIVLLIVALAFLLVLHAMNDGLRAPTVERAQRLTEQLVYERDSRTGLCFAVARSVTYYGYGVYAFTHVPEGACRR
jgi:hypothetical protein